MHSASHQGRNFDSWRVTAETESHGDNSPQRSRVPWNLPSVTCVNILSP